MAGVSYGPAAGLPAGYAQWASGSALVRGHSPGLSPNWFGPSIGALGTNRFDPPRPRTHGDPGVCYIAGGLIGVLHERVLRGVSVPQLSRAALSAAHAVSDVTLVRDLVLIDLVAGLTVHGLQLHDTTAPPLLSPHAPLRYPATQGMAAAWAASNASASFPVPGGQVDGILYVSRFGPTELCIALWDIASPALSWGSSTLLGVHASLQVACGALGVITVA